ncbi:MAG: glycosyltransferase family 2 protein, partial [Candidatus Omnitrophota bacterium]|nr:glycosyltransferase family 2 protein [Candidatus Omnitrophota bacterium]
AAEVLPKVAIIILHYGRSDGIGESDTMELLKNLEDLNYSNYEIMLVDNNSPDGFFSKYKDSLLDRFPKIPKITFIKSEVNLGFSEGNNLAMEQALGNSCDYFFLLNNDTIVDKDSLVNLVEAAEASNDIGMVGPKVYSYYQPNVIGTAGGSFSNGSFGHNEIDNGQYDTQRQVDYVAGTAVLVKKDMYKKVGGLAKELFMYHEEMEWPMRAQKVGYKSIYVPKAKVWHKEARATQGRFSPLTNYYMARNRFYIMRHHPEYMFSSIARLTLSTGNSIVGAILNRDIRAFVSIFKGIYDGLFGHFSKIERGKITIIKAYRDVYRYNGTINIALTYCL